MMLAKQAKPVVRKDTTTESQLGVLPQGNCSGNILSCVSPNCCYYNNPPNYVVYLCCEKGVVG